MSNGNTDNFYNRIMKLADAEDFFRGVQAFDAEEYLKYDENTAPKELLSTIRAFSLKDFTNTAIDIVLYRKYPSHYFIGEYTLSLALQRDVFSGWYYKKIAHDYLGKTEVNPNTEAFEVWNIIKKYNTDFVKMYATGQWTRNIPTHLTDDIYKDILQLEIASKGVIDVFSNLDSFPKWMIEELRQRHPDIWKSINSNDINVKYDLLRRALSFPTSDEMNEVIHSFISGWKLKPDYGYMSEEDKKTNESIRNFHESILPVIYNHGSFESKVHNEVGNEILGAHNAFYSNTPKEIIDTIDALFNAKQQGLAEFNYPETMARYYKDVNNSIQAEFFIIKGIIFKEEALIDLRNKVSGFDPNTSLTLTTSDSTISNYVDDWEETKKYEGQMVLIDEDERVVIPFGKHFTDYVNIKDSKEENRSSFVSPVESSTACRLINMSLADPPKKAQAFKQWFQEKEKDAQEREKTGDSFAVKNFYFEMSNHPVLKLYTQKASNFLSSVIISGHVPTKEEQYDPNNPPHWSNPLDSDFKAAMEVAKRLPPNVLDSMANKLSSWFVLCSGLFSSEVVYKIAHRYPTDAKKVFAAMMTRDEDDKQFLESLKAEIREKIDKSKNDVRKGMKDYLLSPNVVKKKINDFPELMEYCKTFLQSYTNKVEEDYNPTDGYGNDRYDKVYEIALKKLEELDIYFVDANNIISHFGADQLADAGYSPYQMNGFYSPAYGIADNPTIFIFTKGNITQETISNAAENIEKFLGIKSEDRTISFSEENTLWHEVSHHLTGVGIDDASNYQTAAGWITEPSELLAFQYGNLQHMKQRLTAFFNNIFPFDARITSGMNEQIKAELVENFPIEFQGMDREVALETVSEMLEEYEESIFESGTEVSREKQIQNLTNMFAKYFMQQYLKSKTLERMEFDQGKKIVTFPNKSLPPEENSSITLPNTRDEFIKKIQNRPDYQEMLRGIKGRINDYLLNGRREDVKMYLHKNTNSPRKIFSLSDLLSFMFNPPASLSSIDELNKNEIFSNIIPKSLYDFIFNYAKNELATSPKIPAKKPSVTPEEAEELGGFISDMDQEYGPNWVWMASTNGDRIDAYAQKLFSFGQENNKLNIPEEYHKTISEIVLKCKELGLKPYAVGGFVRDLVIGQNKPKDLDIMVDVVDQGKYFNLIDPLIQEVNNNPMDFIQKNLSGAKTLKAIKDFKIIQSQVRPEFFRVLAVIDYIDNSKKKAQEIIDSPFETSINPSMLLANAFGSTVPRGEAFGIYAIKSEVGEIEIAYPRKEEYDAGSRKPRTEMGTVAEDAKRRDFGMNALYLDLENNVINDLTGHGISDIQERKISITDPSAIDIIFQQDPLRILRAFRFAAKLGFEIDQQIIDYIKENPYLISIQGDEEVNEFSPSLSSERIAEELRKIMALPAAPKTLHQMNDLGLLNYILKLPEEASAWNMEHLNKHHYQNIWDHTINVMEQANKIMDEKNVDSQTRMILNFVGLFHDVGKLFPEKGHQNHYDANGNIERRTFVGHPDISTEQTVRILKRLKFSTEEVDRIAKLVNTHDDVLYFNSKNPERLEKRMANLIKVLGDDIYNLIIFGRADRKAHSEGFNDDSELVKAEQYLTPEKYEQIKNRLRPYVNGNELIEILNVKFPRGRWVGILCNFLVDLQTSQIIRSREEVVCLLQIVSNLIPILNIKNGDQIEILFPILRKINNFCAMNNPEAIKRIVIENYKNINHNEQRLFNPLINGDDLIMFIKQKGHLEVKQGKWLGEILTQILDKQVSGEINSKEQALEEAYKIFSIQNNIVANNYMNSIFHTAITKEQVIDQLMKKFNNDKKKVDQIINADPTPNKGYSIWIGKLLLSNNIILPEDTNKLHSKLIEFEDLKKRKKIKGVDINKIQSYKDLAIIVEEAQGVKTKGEQYQESLEKGQELIYSDAEFKVIRITTTEAAAKLARGTEWCIKDPTFAIVYLPQGPLIMVYLNNKPYALFHYPTGQAKDVYDNNINEEMAKKLAKIWDKLEQPELTREAAVIINYIDRSIINQNKAYFATYLYDKNRIDEDQYLALLKESNNTRTLAMYYYRNKRRFPKEEVELYVSQLGETAFRYARNDIKGPWPMGEPAIAQDAIYAVNYAQDILKGRFELGEPAIARHPIESFVYLEDFIEERWPEAEEAISKNPESAVKYAISYLPGERFLIAEKTIVREFVYAFQYMGNKLKLFPDRSWPELENRLFEEPNGNFFYNYVFSILQAPCKKYEEYILDKFYNAKEVPINEVFNYATMILKRRWPEAEPVLLKNMEVAFSYSKHFGRIDVIEKDLLENVAEYRDIPIKYCHEFIEARWPELEEAFLKNPQTIYSVSYANDFIGGRWPDLEQAFINIVSKETAVNEKLDNIIEKYWIRILNRNRWYEIEPYLNKFPYFEEAYGWQHKEFAPKDEMEVLFNNDYINSMFKESSNINNVLIKIAAEIAEQEEIFDQSRDFNVRQYSLIKIEDYDNPLEYIEDLLLHSDVYSKEYILNEIDKLGYNCVKYQLPLTHDDTVPKEDYYVIDDTYLITPSFSDLENLEEWIAICDVDDLVLYESDNDISGTYYHVTHPDNIESILSEGLRISNESRGIDNRFTGDAVFLSEEPHEAYGSAIFSVDLGSLISDYILEGRELPEMQKETPIQECEKRTILAHYLKIEDYFCEPEQGISEDTVVVFESIPPKYIKLEEDFVEASDTMMNALFKISNEVKRVKQRKSPVNRNKYNDGDDMENIGPGGKGYKNKNTVEKWHNPTTSDTPQLPPVMQYPSNDVGNSWAQVNPQPQGNFVNPNPNKQTNNDLPNHPNFKFKFSIPLGAYEKGDVLEKEKKQVKKVDIFKNDSSNEWLSVDYKGKEIFLGKDLQKALEFLRKVYNWKMMDYIGGIKDRNSSGSYEISPD